MLNENTLIISRHNHYLFHNTIKHRLNLSSFGQSNINSVKFHNALNFELVNEENGYLTFSFDLYKKKITLAAVLNVG